MKVQPDRTPLFVALLPDMALARPIRYSDEKEFQFCLSALLAANRIEHQCEVRAQLGTYSYIAADLVVGDTAIECKVDIGQDSILKALGQCTAYVASGLANRAILVIPVRADLDPAFAVLFKRCGVEILNEAEVVGFFREPWPSNREQPEILTAVNFWCRNLRARHSLLCVEEEQAFLSAVEQDGRPVFEIVKEIARDISNELEARSSCNE